MGDHPGSGAAPMPALGAAAAVTSNLELGTCVMQARWEGGTR
jgi:alkanesulfonate monooxygenase SsuD/methylene tetrahydromethanopterin reductase-like flavin-dependent oxidoreductase (luciferase family)